VKGVALLLVGVAAVLVTAGASASRSNAQCKPVVVTGTAFSPDSKWVAFTRQRACDALPSLVVMRIDGRSRHTVGKAVLDWSWAPKGNRIAFTPVAEAGSALVVATPLGRRLKNVSLVTAFAWAPNGKELAARRRRPEDVVVVPLSGSVRHVADAPLGSFRAGHALEWAPNGRSVLFTEAGDGPMLSIRIVGRDGSGEHELSRGRSPDWSPDGSRIVYASGPTDLPTWSTIQPDGSDARPVGPVRSCTTTSWAPRGRWLAFTAYCAFGLSPQGPETWVDSSAGGSLLDLGGGFASWSPTGTRLALTRPDEGEVTLVNPDGTGRAELPYGDGVAWAPGGARLAVGDGRLYLVGANGRGSHFVARGQSPVWSPSGKLLSFSRRRTCGDDLYVLRLTPKKLRRALHCT
jgi:Tol biopolymer transport system component